MNKMVKRFVKILLLIAIIFSDLMAPISVLANEINSVEANEGDIGINETISNEDSVTVTAGNFTNEGDVQITKTVSKVKDDNDNVIEGRYNIEFNIKGKEKSNIIEVTKPLYLVIVFDTSNSMICGDGYVDTTIDGTPHYTMQDGTEIKCYDDSYEYNSSILTKDKWETAVNGAIKFSEDLADMNDTYISLVTFGGDASEATDFVHDSITASQFHYNSSGTNIKAGINEAQEKLNTINDENVQKYIVLIGDGIPTSGGGFWTSDEEAAMNAANNAKLAGTKIFSIGYDISNNKDAQEILEYISSNYTVSENDYGNIVTEYQNLGYYKDAGVSEDEIVSALHTTFQELGEPKKAGTNAVLTDNIGSAFNIINEDGTLSDASSIELSVGDITETGTTISFDVEIDESKVTSDGWYNTNDGFSLTYTDANDTEQSLSSNDNPQVWWTPNVYEYTVNYYKDSISGTPVASDKISATNGTVVSFVDQNKYLNNSSLGTVGYEFASVTNLPATISDNNTVINVLYTIKKFSYDVNYYYDGELDEELSNTVSNVSYGTEVNAPSLYSVGAKEGYSLVTGTTTNGTVVIDEENIEINIYYAKNSYGYNVNYHFNNELGFSKNDNALFESIVKASDNYLSDNELEDKNIEDNTEYFISPILPSNPNQITIGTNVNDNVINIYYVSTVVTEENIEKISNTDKITSGDALITYTVNYTSIVSNVNKGDTVKVVVTDTLPLEIDESKSTLNGGVYDATSKTITWEFEDVMTEFTENYNASKTITYTVVYKNVGNGDGSDLVNTVVGTTTAGGKTTQEIGDSDTVEVEIPSSVIVHYYVDGTTTSVYADETLNGLVGKEYVTSAKDVFGYTVNSEKLPSNASGIYTEDTIEVIYYYVKNDGSINNTDVVKTSTNDNKTVDSINSSFNYTITATGEVKDYVGNITIKVVDNLPYELTEETIENLNQECVYDGVSKTITCTREKIISESDYIDGVYNVNEEFTLELAFVDIEEATVTNSVKVTITLNDSEVEEDDDATEDVTVKDGDVIVHHYVDGTTTSVYADETLNGLVGKEYVTSAKDVFGYTVNSEKLPSNASGIYTEDTIEVIYYYVKNDGSINNTDVVKTSTNDNKTVDSINSSFNYTITATGEVKDYVGNITIKVVDNLPYELTEETIENLNQECVYDGVSKTITCTREKIISESDYIDGVYNVNEKFTLELAFVDIEEATVTNSAKVTITLNDSEVEEDDDTTEDVTVKSGSVIVKYKVVGTDIYLTENITLNGLSGEKYTTQIKEFYGYSLVKIPQNKDGIYLANQTIEVKYEYTKNDGVISGNTLVKNGPSSVSRIDDTFNYTFEYDANITGYTGSVTLKVIDTLPFGVVIVSKDNRCTYDGNRTITCIQNYNIDSDTNISENFNVSFKYVGIEFDDITVDTTLTNGLVAEIIYGDNKVTNTTSKDTVIGVGTVVVTYKDTQGNELSNNITLKGLAGSEYITEEKTFFGYTLIGNPDYISGEYAANQTIYVNYIYSKNNGTIVEDKTDVIKTANDADKKIESVNDVFSYTIEVKGEVKDYVGNVTIKVVDTLPYELTEEAISALNQECQYNGESKTVTCTRVRNISEDNYINGVYAVNEIFNLEFTFVEVTEEIVVNNAKVEIKLDSDVKTEDTDTEEVKVEKGNVTVTYKVEGTNISLAEDVVLDGLVGNSYETEVKEFYGYTLTSVPLNANGVYTKDDITVNYVYSKNIGTSEEEFVKEGKEEKTGMDEAFEYKITYNTIISDYVGEATLIITDELPYEIDEEKSVYNKENCKYTDGMLVCTYSKNITKNDNSFAIEENFALYYINVDSNKVTNKANAILTYGNVSKENDSEYTSEVKEGTVTVNYVTKDGTKLMDSIVLTGLVGEEYTTVKENFDKYSFIEIIGNAEGKYSEENIEVTYVYDLTPLPPKTGVDINMFMYIKYLVIAAIVVVCGKMYNLIKNN